MERNKFPKGNKLGKKITSGAQAAQMGSKGGKKSQEVQAEAKSFRDCLKIILSLPGTAKEIENLDRATGGVFPDNLKNKMMIVCAAQVQKALAGDYKAAEWLSKILGENVLKIVGDPDQPLISNKISMEQIKELKSLIDEDEKGV